MTPVSLPVPRGRSPRALATLLASLALPLLAACGDSPTDPEGTDATVAPVPLAAGLVHTCALSASGATWCWGDNAFGQVGNATAPLEATTPEPVTGAPPFVALTVSRANLTAGPHFSCGLTAEGDAYCWGSNVRGMFGAAADAEPCPGRVVNGSPSDNACNRRAVRVAAGTRFTALSAGGRFLCGITPERRVLCWGASETGAMGTGDTAATAPTPVTSDHRYVQLSAGEKHACAVRTSGEIDCWGANDVGQLGDGTTFQRRTPAPVRSTETFARVSAGFQHTCAVTRAGRAYCWGRNQAAQLDTDDPTVPWSDVPRAAASTFTVAQTGAAFNYSCALATDGRVLCWGPSFNPGLGRGTVISGECFQRYCGVRPSETDERFQTLAVGGVHTCARTAAGATWCWGSNLRGAVGVGVAVNGAVFTPTRVFVP